MTTYVFDIDGTICKTPGSEYSLATPITERIKTVNNLFDSGNRIFFQTARGMGSSNNNTEISSQLWRKLTIDQLNQWNIKFHGLFFGKPSGDFYVDDKGMSDLLFFKDS